MSSIESIEAKKAILDFYKNSGVDIIVSDNPVDSFAVPATAPAMKKSPQKYIDNSPDIGTNSRLPLPFTGGEKRLAFQGGDISSSGNSKLPTAIAPTAIIQPLNEVIGQAVACASKAHTVQELGQMVREFEGCALKKFATNTVFSDGNPEANIMLIGEAPGASEDEQGIPFCGASGKLLDKMLASINLTRDKVYISNTVFWRPPGNRVPAKEELTVCLPFVEKHIALVNPKLLIFCGGTAATHMLKSNTGITKLRGKFYNYKNDFLEKEIQAAVLFHPSFLLRSPGQKRQAWHDLQMIEAALERVD